MSVYIVLVIVARYVPVTSFVPFALYKKRLLTGKIGDWKG
jgi:hypothetical protein